MSDKMTKKPEDQEEDREDQKGVGKGLKNKDLWRIFGVPIAEAKAIKPDHKYKFEEPDMPIIDRKDYGTPETFYRRFFDKYINIEGSVHSQKYESKKCTYKDPITKQKCRGINSDKPKLVRAHYLSHFSSKDYEKFVCPRCKKNYEKYDSLISHGEKGMCKIQSSYPSLKEFALKEIAKHPKQDENSKTCSNCLRTFSQLSYAHEHFLSCIKFTYPCFKEGCKSLFGSYNMARRHFEECEGGEKVYKPRFVYKIDMPNSSDDKKWTRGEMMSYIESHAIPKIEKVAESYPQGSKIYVGYSSQIKSRLTSHFSSNLIFNRHEANPILDDNDYILGKFWTKKDAMTFEYLVQKHTSTPEGMFYTRVGHLMNHHNIAEPKNITDTKKSPHHVYMVVSSAQYYPERVGDTEEEDEIDEKQPGNSSAKQVSINTGINSGPSTSTGGFTSTKDYRVATLKRRIEVSDDDSDDEPLIKYRLKEKVKTVEENKKKEKEEAKRKANKPPKGKRELNTKKRASIGKASTQDKCKMN